MWDVRDGQERRTSAGPQAQVNADGSDQRRLTNNSADDLEPAWSPDGMCAVSQAAARHGMKPGRAYEYTGFRCVVPAQGLE